MPDFMSPEPIRSDFDTERAYSLAWMRWAQRTPGGWQARLAERVQAQWPAASPTARRIPVTTGETEEPPTSPGPHAVEPSPCCRTTVVIDPLPAVGRNGLCSSCGALLDYVVSGWELRPGT